MSKKKVTFALLFIASISLLNVAALIEATYEADQLDADAFKLLPFFASSVSLHTNKLCNYVSNQCDIASRNNNCLQYARDCSDQ